MQEVDKREFAEVWGAAWAMHGKSVSPQLLSIAFEALRAYSIEEVRIGLTRHIQSPDTGQFFPKPADVIKHIDGNSGSRAMVAWNTVDKAVRQVGAWTSVMFDDALIHRVISDMGGWVELCKVDDREYPFKQKGFDMQAPVAVGDWSKAAQVYTRGIADFSAVPLKKISPKAIQALLGNQLEDKNEND